MATGMRVKGRGMRGLVPKKETEKRGVIAEETEKKDVGLAKAALLKKPYEFSTAEVVEHLVKPQYFYSRATIIAMEGDLCTIEYSDGSTVRVSKETLRPIPTYAEEYGSDDEVNALIPGNRVEVRMGDDFWMGWVIFGPDYMNLYAIQFDWRFDKIKKVAGRNLRRSQIFNIQSSTWETAPNVFN